MNLIFDSHQWVYTHAHLEGPLEGLPCPKKRAPKLDLALLLVLFLCWQGVAYPNNLGIPEVQNFPVEAYLGAPQNWDVDQDEVGRIIVANNKGVLVYDGLNWEIFPLPQQTIVRSIEPWIEGRILAGGQSEIGYFDPKPEGGYLFVSLLDQFKEEDRLFEDVWDLVLTETGFAFRSAGNVYINEGNSFKVISLANPIVHLSNYGGKLLIQTQEDGLFELNEGDYQTVPFAGKARFGSQIVSIIERAGRPGLAFTLKDGIFQLEKDTAYSWEQSYSTILKTSRIAATTLLRDGRIAIALYQGGVVLIDESGRAIYNVTKKQGLQNSTVLSLFEDAMGDLWLGLGNGIDLVNLSSPVRRFFPDGELAGTGYAALVHDGYIYFGTNHGLYRIPWQDYYYPFGEVSQFELVKGSAGHVWGLSVQDGHLLMGHHEGAFLVKGNQAFKLSDGGAWDFVSVPSEKNRAVAGTYEGLNLLGKEGSTGEWKMLNKLEGLNESSRIIISDPKGWVWVTHPYRGVWKCIIQGNKLTSVAFYGEKNGFPSNRLIYAFDLGTEIVFCAEKGIYRYDEASDSFMPHAEFMQLFGEDIWLQKLVSDPNGDLWFVENDRVGLLNVQENSLSKEVNKQVFEFLNKQLVGGHELIYPAPDGNVFFATSKGFLQYRKDWTDRGNSNFKAMLVAVRAFGKRDSLIMEDGTTSKNLAENLPSETSVFQFDFSDNQFSGLNPSTYQFYLEGLDEDWGDWTSRKEKEYTNLRPGTYKFHLKARNNFLEESKPITYEFKIAAAWYQSRVAYLIYAILLIAALSVLVLVPRKLYEKDKKQLKETQARTLSEQQEKHNQEEKEREGQIIQLRNEKLKAELSHQNQELASATMHLVQKNSLIVRVKEDLAKVGQSEDLAEVGKITRQLLGILNRDARLDDEWEQFSVQFDKVHHDFLARLKERFSQLTPKDLKLCAFLKMNLSTKEIAPLLNISIRGVEISRYRLRKKLELSGDVNLIEYMMEI